MIPCGIPSIDSLLAGSSTTPIQQDDRDAVGAAQALLSGQEQRLTEAMKTVEGELGDDLHAKVTTLLVELSAYNVMRLLHELQAERARVAFGKA